MRLFILMYILLGAGRSFAAIEWIRLKDNTAVYKSTQDNAALLLMANAGEKVAVRGRGRGFARIQIKRGGKWRVGYIRLEELESNDEPEAGAWGFGGGGDYTYLKQGRKQFETADQVNYSLGATSSTSFSPWFAAQSARQDFWRAILTYRLVDFSTQQTTDVALSQANALKLKYTMLSGALQKMWNFNRAFYSGLGIEFSRALSASLTIGGSRFPVDQSNLPTYIGGHIALGYQNWVSSKWSFFLEVRAQGYFNQSPMIFGAESALGLIYWP
jgi:hypothetical protein